MFVRTKRSKRTTISLFKSNQKTWTKLFIEQKFTCWNIFKHQLFLYKLWIINANWLVPFCTMIVRLSDKNVSDLNETNTNQTHKQPKINKKQTKIKPLKRYDHWWSLRSISFMNDQRWSPWDPSALYNI